ncbi:MAG: hypothetical protein KGJ06_07085, partial [Pseudomonadota bacterium]|nr:hypothetical protein [Pseudomonadota bacterium]
MSDWLLNPRGGIDGAGNLMTPQEFQRLLAQTKVLLNISPDGKQKLTFLTEYAILTDAGKKEIKTLGKDADKLRNYLLTHSGSEGGMTGAQGRADKPEMSKNGNIASFSFSFNGPHPAEDIERPGAFLAVPG